MTNSTDSGFAWIGKIPEHWSVEKFRYVFKESKETNGPRPVGEMLSVSQYRGIAPKDYENDSLKRTDGELENYRVVRPGQLVVNTMWLNHGGLAVSNLEGHVSPAYRAYEIRNDLEPRFANYLMRSSAYIAGYTKFLTGVRPNSLQMAREDLMRFPILVPPLDEQRRIADHLDRELSQIDGLIRLKEQLVSGLLEARFEKVAQFALKGLEGAALNHNDAVSFLGRAPREWPVKRLKFSVASTTNGFWGEEPLEDGSDIWCVRIADFDRIRGLVGTSKKTLRSMTQFERANRLLEHGDLVIERSGGGDAVPVGSVVLYDHDEEAVCSNFATRIRLKRGQNPRYWRYVHSILHHRGVVWRSIKQTSGIQNLDLRSYLNEVAPFPPKDEQDKIADFLDDLTGEIDYLVDKATTAIELLRERKRSLISVAATGQTPVGGD